MVHYASALMPQAAGAHSSGGTVLLNCAQPVEASMTIAAATRIGKT